MICPSVSKASHASKASSCLHLGHSVDLAHILNRKRTTEGSQIIFMLELLYKLVSGPPQLLVTTNGNFQMHHTSNSLFSCSQWLKQPEKSMCVCNQTKIKLVAVAQLKMPFRNSRAELANELRVLIFDNVVEKK